MKPICHPCQRFFRPEKNGFFFIEGMPVGPDRAAPGKEEPEKWKPYKLWVGDLWKCQGCGTTIIVGFATSPIAEHFEPVFAAEVAKRHVNYQVNDC